MQQLWAATSLVSKKACRLSCVGCGPEFLEVAAHMECAKHRGRGPLFCSPKQREKNGVSRTIRREQETALDNGAPSLRTQLTLRF